jgi:hypothetical protein
VEPGFRGIKSPAALAPVWLEKPARIAALARLTGLGWLVYGESHSCWARSAPPIQVPARF